MGHFPTVCKSSRSVRKVETPGDATSGNSENDGEDTYNINLFRVKKSTNSPKPKLLSNHTNKHDFKVQVVIHNSVDNVIADTGARVSVCGTAQARKWNLLSKMHPSTAKIKPYNSAPIPVYGIANCAVTFGSTSVPVTWHIISGSCEPILAGNSSLQLGIIKFNSKPDTFQPILMCTYHEITSFHVLDGWGRFRINFFLKNMELAHFFLNLLHIQLQYTQIFH